jgi:nicotinamidase-related amidase
MSKISIDPKSTALILIDLQKGILGMPLAPLSSQQIVGSAHAISAYFRRLGAPVVLVNVAYPSAERKPHVDMSMPMPKDMPSGWDELVDGLGQQPTDIRITKRGWSAFQHTDLDEQLKKRGINSIVIGGVATNFGVESTAREAMGLNYDVIFASDVMSTISPRHQEFVLNQVFPMMGRVRSSADIMS